MNKILAIFGFLNKAIDKIPDGNTKEQAKVQIKELEIMLLMRLSWVVGLAVIIIYLNFFLKLAFMPGYFDNLSITTATELVLVILATKFIFNLDMNTVKDTFKFFTKDFWKQ